MRRAETPQGDYLFMLTHSLPTLLAIAATVACQQEPKASAEPSQAEPIAQAQESYEFDTPSTTEAVAAQKAHATAEAALAGHGGAGESALSADPG